MDVIFRVESASKSALMLASYDRRLERGKFGRLSRKWARQDGARIDADGMGAAKCVFERKRQAHLSRSVKKMLYIVVMSLKAADALPPSWCGILAGRAAAS